MIPDGITSSIAYSDSKRSKTVITGTNASKPAGLQRVLRALKGVLGEIR